MVSKSEQKREKSIAEYGLAIIFVMIIAVVVVALLALNGFRINNEGNPLAIPSSSSIKTSCTAAKGAICAMPSSYPGGFLATLGQLSNKNWKFATIAFVPNGSVMPNNLSSLYSYPDKSVLAREIVNGIVNNDTEFSDLESGYIMHATFNDSYSIDSDVISYSTIIPNKSGSFVSGSIWAIYTINGSIAKGPFHSIELANAVIAVN
ncbi:hypothetical protein Mia14_0608 [Candidatus Mancarchaeum acidiphilum]|uniref:Uncharacterized protein n=1 Tax=Candidatus Mancarchaeum acidiphilum TaxID=1920749 RepID=A0A218NN66_9ARCH|nr:hypothetical protein [Candidatus Mancarchaeum acidiphilum]ASI13911.1 hypothetical protein Mia14_0608 [Candidatus Mancarchaeum acidiphilum]